MLCECARNSFFKLKPFISKVKTLMIFFNKTIGFNEENTLRQNIKCTEIKKLLIEKKLSLKNPALIFIDA